MSEERHLEPLLCGEVDEITGAVCNNELGHSGNTHCCADDGIMFTWVDFSKCIPKSAVGPGVTNYDAWYEAWIDFYENGYYSSSA